MMNRSPRGDGEVGGNEKKTRPCFEVPGTYARMSTEKPRRIYEARPGLDCEPNCRDLQAKRTEESPLLARFGSVGV